MNRAVFYSLLAFVAGCCCDRSTCCRDSVMGEWSAKLPYETRTACTLSFFRDENGLPKAAVLFRGGEPEVVRELKVEKSHFSFWHPHGQRFEGDVLGDRLFARLAPCDRTTGVVKGAWKPFEGWRNPEIYDGVRTEDAKFAAPINLLKNGLADWELMSESQNGWSFKDGVLSNHVKRDASGKVAGRWANLATKRADFFDFRLDFDVRVPKGANSGVYLRGRFECQVFDSYGLPPDVHSMAAYYGRVAPSVAAEKAPGEWQHVTVTVYKGHLTTVLNGVKIIDNAKLVGVTGGAIDSNLNAPGPIYIQGDHTDADFRNMILRPAL